MAGTAVAATDELMPLSVECQCAGLICLCRGLIRHVCNNHNFRDAKLFYKTCDDEREMVDIKFRAWDFAGQGTSCSSGVSGETCCED